LLSFVVLSICSAELLPPDTTWRYTVGLDEDESHLHPLTIERIHREMGERFISLKKLDSRFGLLLDVKELMCRTNESSLKQRCIDIGKVL